MFALSDILYKIIIYAQHFTYDFLLFSKMFLEQVQCKEK